MANRRFIDFPIASTVGDNDIVLIWQDGANKQTTKATILSGLPENLEDLNDVVISGLTNGQILRYDSVTGKWENTDQGNLDLNDLNDVSIISPSNGQVLVYNSSTSKWENSSGGFVPYVGAVTTVDLGAQGLRAGYVRFDTSVASVPDEQGLMYWDASRSTAALIMNGTLQHIGQDTFFYVKNSSGSNIPKGTCVRFAGTDGASGHLLIAPFLANGSVPSSYFMGVTAEAIANGSFGQVMHFGELEGINTSGFTAGALLYASTTVAGVFQTTAPVAPNNIVLVAAAVNSKNNGAIIVRPQIGSNINNDEGVKITSPTTGDLLQLQAGGLWENKTIDGAGIVTKATSQVISGLKTFNVNTLMMQSSGNANAVYLSNSSGSSTYQSGFNFFGFNTDNHIYFAKSSITGGNTGILAWTNTATRTYTLKDASGTLAFTSDIPANPVGGTGTTNYLPKFTGSTTIGNSQIFDNGTGVGIGTTSPQTVSSGFTLTVGDGATQQQPYLALSRNSLGGFWAGIRWYDGNTIKSVIQEDSDFNLRFSTSNAERLRITSGGNLLVGTTTDNGARLQVSGTANITSNGNSVIAFRINDTNANASFLSLNASNVDAAIIANGTSGIPLDFYTGGSQRMRLNSSGNLGLGVTPNTWTGTGVKAFQFQNGSLAASNTFGALFGWNTYYEGTYKYVSNSTASAFLAAGNDFIWYQAPSGTAGNAISFTQAMTLTSGGNLLLGTTTDAGVRLQVNGAVRIFAGNVLTMLQPDNGNGFNIRSVNNGDFRLSSGGTPDAFNVTNSGNVGIGTTTISSAVSGSAKVLAIVDNATANVGSVRVYGGGTLTSLELYGGASAVGLFGSTNHPMVFSTNSTERMRITSGGDVYLNNAAALFFGPTSVTYLTGSTTNMIFAVNDAERMRITSGGNVGIGTSSPTNGLLVINSTAATGVRFALESSGTMNGVVALGSNAISGLSTTDLALWTRGVMAFETGASGEKMRITSSGNVLIGTTTDDSKRLRVNGTISSLNQDAFFLSNLGNTTDTKNWSIQNLDSSGQFRIRAGNDAQTDGQNALVISRSGISITNTSFPNGNVLIGTTTDNGARLQVIGNTYSEGLHIATGQFVQGASATNTFYTFSNTSINRVFLITLRQSGSSANNVVAIGFTFGGALGAYNVIQDNTNPVLFLTISASGLGLRLTTGSGYGTTTWDWTITQIK